MFVIYKLKLTETVAPTIPTIGFSVKRPHQFTSALFTVWDVGGQEKIHPLLRVQHFKLQDVKG